MSKELIETVKLDKEPIQNLSENAEAVVFASMIGKAQVAIAELKKACSSSGLEFTPENVLEIYRRYQQLSPPDEKEELKTWLENPENREEFKKIEGLRIAEFFLQETVRDSLKVKGVRSEASIQEGIRFIRDLHLLEITKKTNEKLDIYKKYILGLKILNETYLLSDLYQDKKEVYTYLAEIKNDSEEKLLKEVATEYLVIDAIKLHKFDEAKAILREIKVISSSTLESYALGYDVSPRFIAFFYDEAINDEAISKANVVELCASLLDDRKRIKLFVETITKPLHPFIAMRLIDHLTSHDINHNLLEKLSAVSLKENISNTINLSLIINEAESSNNVDALIEWIEKPEQSYAHLDIEHFPELPYRVIRELIQNDSPEAKLAINTFVKICIRNTGSKQLMLESIFLAFKDDMWLLPILNGEEFDKLKKPEVKENSQDSLEENIKKVLDFIFVQRRFVTRTYPHSSEDEEEKLLENMEKVFLEEAVKFGENKPDSAKLGDSEWERALLNINQLIQFGVTKETLQQELTPEAISIYVSHCLTNEQAAKLGSDRQLKLPNSIFTKIAKLGISQDKLEFLKHKYVWDFSTPHTFHDVVKHNLLEKLMEIGIPTDFLPSLTSEITTLPKELIKHLDYIGLETWPVTEDELKRAYRQISPKYHPDRDGDDEKFKILNATNEMLKAMLKETDYGISSFLEEGDKISLEWVDYKLTNEEMRKKYSEFFEIYVEGRLRNIEFPTPTTAESSDEKEEEIIDDQIESKDTKISFLKLSLLEKKGLVIRLFNLNTLTENKQEELFSYIMDTPNIEDALTAIMKGDNQLLSKAVNKMKLSKSS